MQGTFLVDSLEPTLKEVGLMRCLSVRSVHNKQATSVRQKTGVPFLLHVLYDVHSMLLWIVGAYLGWTWGSIQGSFYDLAY